MYQSKNADQCNHIATNVYEEKSLGLSEDDEVSADAGLQHLKQEEGYVSLHLRDQLAVGAVCYRDPQN